MSPRLLSVLVLAASLAGCASSYRGFGPDSTAVSVQQQLPPPDLTQPVVPNYRLGPADAITVRVFGVTDLDLETTVDSSGHINMHLIGEVRAAGLTAGELSEAIANGLRGRYVRDPRVSVVVREVRSQLMTVDGAVQQPGTYPVIGNMSLMRAIATARGTTEFAMTERIAVFRTVNNQPMAALFSLRDIREGRYPDPAIYPNDVVMVGESGSRRFMRDVLQALPALGVFTPLLAANNNN